MKLILSLILLLTTSALFAQTDTVKGVVTFIYGKPGIRAYTAVLNAWAYRQDSVIQRIITCPGDTVNLSLPYIWQPGYKVNRKNEPVPE